MIIIKQTNNALWECFANPAFQMLYNRIQVLLKDLTCYRADDDSWQVLDTKSENIRQKEITDADYIDPLTKRIYQTLDVNSVTYTEADQHYRLADGTIVYPAYSYILATQLKQLIPNWETTLSTITDETALSALTIIGDLYIYDLVKTQIETMVEATGWHIA